MYTHVPKCSFPSAFLTDFEKYFTESNTLVKKNFFGDLNSYSGHVKINTSFDVLFLGVDFHCMS